MANQDYQDWVRKVVIPVSFRSLTDTPGSFDGVAKKSVVVNDTETGLVFSDVSLYNHSARHEEGAADEITGITGKLNNHSARHEEGAVDEITGITGKLNNHSTRHENGEADEISVAGLSGVLTDRQKPSNHASRHENGGADPVNIVNLPDYSEITVELGGDFVAGEKIKLVKIGNWVWITGEGVLSHTESNSAYSASGVIPPAYRPLYRTVNTYRAGPLGNAIVRITTDGTFVTLYWDWDGFTYDSPNTMNTPIVFYLVA